MKSTSVRLLTLSLLTVTLLTLTGCATHTLTDEQLDNHLNKWVGHTTDELMLAWGTPVRSTALSDGRKMITFQYTNTYTNTNGASWDAVCTVEAVTRPDSNEIMGFIEKGAECWQETSLQCFPAP